MADRLTILLGDSHVVCMNEISPFHWEKLKPLLPTTVIGWQCGYHVDDALLWYPLPRHAYFARAVPDLQLRAFRQGPRMVAVANDQWHMANDKWQREHDT